MARLTADERREMRKRCEATTPGPFHSRLFDESQTIVLAHNEKGHHPLIANFTGDNRFNDAAFFVGARIALPRALQEIDALEAERDHLEELRVNFVAAANASGELLQKFRAERDAEQADLAVLRQQVAEMRERAEAFDWLGAKGTVEIECEFTVRGDRYSIGEQRGNFRTLLEAVRAARKEQG